MLAVSDTGCGMDKETQAHIFEPFFTTKEQGKGTGLGLSTVYGIVKQSGGDIWVYSEPGQGTVFKVYLPSIDQTTELVDQDQTRVEVLGGSETILLVEDEAPVRDLICRVLRQRGYAILEVVRGDEVLRMCEQYTGPIHLLIADMVMPQMSGRELAKRLVALRPQTKVLYISGYTDSTFLHHGGLNPGIAFLQKPFTVDALVRKVRGGIRYSLIRIRANHG